MTKNRRKNPRLVTDLKLSVSIEDDVYSTHMLDLSLGGVQIQKPAHCSALPSQECYLVIEDTDTHVSFGMDTEVVWTNEQTMGLKILNISKEAGRLLNRMLSDFAKQALTNKNIAIMG